VATTIVAIEDKGLEMYSGDYKYYMDNRPEVKEKVQNRFVAGDARKLGNAVVVEVADEKEKKKKNFGGGGGPSGKKDKGVKNAKRMN
jgi:ATP-binding cassette subfamily F protein 3